MQQGGVGPTVAACGGHTDSNIKDRDLQYKNCDLKSHVYIHFINVMEPIRTVFKAGENKLITFAQIYK